MLKVTLTLDAQQKLASLLAKDEDFDQPYLRIRSVVAGGGWHGSCVLRLGIDEKDELEDEVEAVCSGLPFIVHPDIISSYGDEFHIEMDENNRPVVTSMLVVRDKERSLFRPRTTVRETGC